jgi:allantoinase
LQGTYWPSLCGVIEKIEKAKQEGLPITAETCPQYIYFNAEGVPDAHSVIITPPIRMKNNDLLKQACKMKFRFYFFRSPPASPAIKEIETGNLKAPGRYCGFTVLIAFMTLKENMSLEEFIPLMTTQPTKFVKQIGEIKPGNYADLYLGSNERSVVKKIFYSGIK